MEDGELEDVKEEKRIPEKRGAKRNQSVLDEDDMEETLSIQPPPVATKKHKRHHKKHKLGKEEKKKKRHRRSSDPMKRENDMFERESKPDREERRRNYDDHLPITRVHDNDISKRRDYSNRPNDRLQRSSEIRSDRGKYTNYKSHSDRDYSRSRDDRIRGPGGYSGNRPYKPPQQGRVPAYPPRDEKTYSEGKPKPLLIRQYDNDDYNRNRTKARVGRDDRGRHERSVSSSVVVSSTITQPPSRRSEGSIDTSVRRRQADDQFFESNGHKHYSDERLLSKKSSPLLTKKTKSSIENNSQFHTEVVSSEDSSESSESSASEEEEEVVEILKRSRRKKHSKRSKKHKEEEEENVEEDQSSSEEVEEDAEVAQSSSEVESDGSAASDVNGTDTEESVEDDEEDDDDADADEVEADESAEESGSNAEAEPGELSDENPESDGEENKEFLADIVSPEHTPVENEPDLPFYYPAIQGCRSVDEFQCLNRIGDGTYGVVYRAKDKRTDEIVALKRLKMEKEREGFPITSLREVSTLLKAHHPNCVRVQEIVVGSNVDKIYIVMDYVEHDLKSLMETMKQPFLVGEVKTLMIQLLRGIHHLHDNWILHRDLKTSNLLLSHKGILKIGDFGLAREYGSPLKPYTPIVVTLWYRSPELLLGVKEYSTAVDMWSVGCIFAEFLSKKPLFPGKSENMQLNLIFKELGTPSEKIWPGYSELPLVKKINSFTDYPYNTLRKRFGATDISEKGFDLMNRFLTYCPAKRVTSIEALKHVWFLETPKPVEPSMFPTWPAKSEQAPNKKILGSAGGSPRAPEGAMGYNKLLNEEEKLGFQLTAPKHGISKHGMGFSLKF